MNIYTTAYSFVYELFSNSYQREIFSFCSKVITPICLGFITLGIHESMGQDGVDEAAGVQKLEPHN